MKDGRDFFDELIESEKNEGIKWPPPWIVSFSDLMTLLLTFFIFFFSVTTLEELPKILRHLRGDEGLLIVPIDKNEFPVPAKSTLIEKKYIKRESEVIAEFRKYLKKTGLAKDISLTAGEKEIKVTIKNPILFALGKADLKADARPVLSKLAELFKGNDNYIRVEGHTDNLPIRTDKFPSNWELSSARAIGVIRYFIDEAEISPTRFEALGYGEFRPAARNDTATGRAQNRRVEIKILQIES